MTFLLIWNKNERKDLLLKIIEIYLNDKILSIDELHYILELIIHDIIKIDKSLFNEDFYILCEKFKDDFLDKYNDLDEFQIDIYSSNYVLKDEFHKSIIEFYNQIINGE